LGWVKIDVLLHRKHSNGVENWNNVYSLVIVDYRPGAGGAYDTLQAAFEVKSRTPSMAPLIELLLMD